jgi:tripartite-type tricarboxylate transporter receptor subunit TctC
MRRRSAILAGVMAVSALGAPFAPAQDYPNRLIKMVNGFPAGGNVDAIARVMAQEMSKGLGQPIVVENKPGLVGSLAAEQISRADPDGYTLLLVPSAHAVTAALYKNLKYKPVEDFAWISTVSFYPFVICVRRDSPIDTLGGLLRAAGERPGEVSFGTSGTGSIQHMTVELLSQATGRKFLRIPYRGEAHAMTGLLGGDIDFVVTTTTVAAAQAQAGTVKALGVTSKTRWKDLPDVPTVEEAGVPGFEVVSWSGLATVAGTPRPVLERLHAEVQRALAVPEVRQRLESFGGEVRGTTPAQMRALVEQQWALWARVVREANIQPE